MRSKADVTGAREIAALVAAVRPDVLHLQDRRAGLVGRLLAVGRIPTVYTLHGVPDELAPLVPGNLAVAAGTVRHRWTYLLLERLLARAPRSIVVTPCEALAAYARDHVGVRADRVRTVPNGVGPVWLAADPVRPTNPHPKATWLGVMQPVKRVPELVRAAARVPELRLQLVGDGPERRHVEEAVAAAGTIRKVRFAGYRSDPAPYLRDTDIFVLPSAAEACPMALLQAMACGVPVIASSVGGVPEVVRNGVDGVLVDPGADDQLVSALALLTQDVRLRERLGAAGRARVASHFGIEQTVGSLLAIYEELAG
jgi:glycosyltransferase involved in cell wall biosynthesis